MGLTPSVWGPCAWTTFHLFAAGAPEALGEADRARYAGFFAAAAEVLPCQKCSVHFKEVLAASPLEARTRGELEDWLVGLHNRVNADLGVPQMEPAAARALWAARAAGWEPMGAKTSGGAGSAGVSAGVGAGALWAAAGVAVGAAVTWGWLRRGRTRSRR